MISILGYVDATKVLIEYDANINGVIHGLTPLISAIVNLNGLGN